MLIFYEGLPGSGKSYNACIDYIIPALKAGRTVFSNVDGLNHEQFALLSDLALDKVQALLIQLTDEQCTSEHILKLKNNPAPYKDSLIIIDEAQNFYPASNKKLPDDVVKWVAEHRHDGLDIMFMSQSFKSVHKTIRERVQSKFMFVKMTGVGLSNRYKWEAYEAEAPEKFQKISSATKKYDPKYFGLYASHTSGTQNKVHTSDGRVNVLNGAAFKVYIPLFLLALAFGIPYLIDFFKKPEGFVHTTKPLPVQAAPLVQSAPVPVIPTPPPAPVKDFPDDEFFASAKDKRLRLVSHYKIDGHEFAVIEIIGCSSVENSFRSDELVSMGYRLVHTNFGMIISKADYRATARPFKVNSQYATPKDYQTLATLK